MNVYCDVHYCRDCPISWMYLKVSHMTCLVVSKVLECKIFPGTMGFINKISQVSPLLSVRIFNKQEVIYN